MTRVLPSTPTDSHLTPHALVRITHERFCGNFRSIALSNVALRGMRATLRGAHRENSHPQEVDPLAGLPQ